jgi:hypothetical protein
MNIKITSEEFTLLKDDIIKTYVVGSKLYGTDNINSDEDILVIYETIGESDIYYPNQHQLQYDDLDNNRQYILTTERQFFKNLFSGDSTINLDVILFYDDYNDEQKINISRTYNIIKSLLGFAKRDIRFLKSGKSKLFHVERGLYCAEKLLNNELPDLTEIGKLSLNNETKYLLDKCNLLRTKMNNLFESNELTLYPKNPICHVVSSIEKKLIESNNKKEFRYS